MEALREGRPGRKTAAGAPNCPRSKLQDGDPRKRQKFSRESAGGVRKI